MLKLSMDDPIALANQIHDLFLEDQSLKEGLLKTWEQNIHFLNGQQTLEWDQYQRRFRHVPVTNRRTNRPHVYVTNEIEPIVRTLVSFLTRNKPSATFYPSNPSDDMSVRKAKMGELIQEATWDIDREYEKYVMAAYWLLTAGTVFRKDYWDSSARGQVHISPFEPLAEEMNETPQMEMMEGTVGASGLLIKAQPMDGMQIPHWGDMASAILSPLQLGIDFTVTDFESAGWVLEYSLHAVDWIKEQYGVKAQGYTGRIEEVKAEDNFGRALELDLGMRFQTSMDKGKKPKSQEMAVLKEFYQAPRSDMPWNQGSDKPKGRLIVTASKIALYDGPSPYDWHPYTCCGYEPFLGRFWFKSLVEQLIAIQRRLNEINGAILENAQTMANPQWKVPDGTVKEGIISGKHGLVIPWTPQPHGHEPQKVDGVPLPNQYFNEKNGLIDQMVRIAGSNAVMGGQQPTGVTAAAALQLLLENAQSQHGTLINQWEGFIERSQTKKIQNFQRFCKEPRSDIIQYLRRIRDDIGDLDIQALTGEDLEDNVNVSIESGSSIPKSQAARQSQLMEFAKMGVINIQDPITRQQFLGEFGVTEFDKTNDAEWEKIQWENSKMLKGQPPFPSNYDQHTLHKSCHISETQRPSFIENASDITKQLFIQHIMWHEKQEQMQMQSQMAAQTQMGMPPGAQPQTAPMAA